MSKVNLETSKAAAELLKFQENKGYINDVRLESFGFFLADYVIQGAEFRVDTSNPKKILISEGIISFESELWRSFNAEFLVKKWSWTYYVGFQSEKGFIFGETEPTKNYMRLWSFDTDAAGKIINPVDHRGRLNRVKFKAEYDGVYLNTAEVQQVMDDAIENGVLIGVQTGVAATNEVIGRAENVIVEADEKIAETEIARQGALQTTVDANKAIDDLNKQVDGWDYKEYYNPSLTYNKHNTVAVAGNMYIAIQDVPIGNPPTGEVNDPYWRLFAKKGEDGNGTIYIHHESFISEEDQKDFFLQHEYDQFQGRIEVTIGAVPQFSPENFLETSPTSFSVSERLPKGIKVKVKYFSKAVPLASDIQTAVENIEVTVTSILTDMNHDIDAGMFGETTTGLPLDGGTF